MKKAYLTREEEMEIEKMYKKARDRHFKEEEHKFIYIERLRTKIWEFIIKEQGENPTNMIDGSFVIRYALKEEKWIVLPLCRGYHNPYELVFYNKEIAQKCIEEVVMPFCVRYK